MKNLAQMFNFSSKLWYDKRWVSKTGEASIYLQVTLNGKHDEFPLKLRWPVKHIDLAGCQLLPRHKRDPDAADYNLLIGMEHAKHNEIMRTYRIKKAALDIVIFGKEVRVYDKKESFVAFMKRDALQRFARKEIEKRTWQSANSCIALMVAFDELWPFDKLTVKWMEKFRNHLNTCDFEPGYNWTTIKTVKCYLQRAKAEPMIFVDDNVAGFKNPMPKWKTNFLNRNEVNALIKLHQQGELSFYEKEILRAFLFTCFTSLRISDVYRVNGKWRVTDGFLDFIPKKNEKKKKWVHIPIMPMAMSFVRNTAGRYFDLPTEQEYNRTLKDLAGYAGINKNLTSHYGRHTFGHIYMTSIGNIRGLQEILGHSKIETTQRYAHLDDEYHTESLKKIQDEFPQLLTLNMKKLP